MKLHNPQSIKIRGFYGFHTGLIFLLLMCFAPVLDRSSHAKEVTTQEILDVLPFSDSEKKDLQNGEIVRFSATETDERELAVGMALLLKQTPDKIGELFREAVEFKLIGAVTAFGKIPDKATESDFAKLTLEPNGDKETDRYLDAEAGDTHNLSAQEIASFQAIKKSKEKNKKSAVEAQIRKNLLARYQAYRAKGLAGISPYERGSGEQRQFGNELLEKTKQAKIFAKFFPPFYNVLLNYPEGKTKEISESFYWLNINVFDRPVLVLSHRIGFKSGDIRVGVDRHYYASHEYNGLQSAAGLLPVKDGTLLVYLFRISTDQVGGFGSSAKHPIARGLMGPYVEELFEGIRTKAEKK